MALLACVVLHATLEITAINEGSVITIKEADVHG